MIFKEGIVLTPNDVDRTVPKTKSVRMPTFVETLLMVERGSLEEFLYTRELDVRYTLSFNLPNHSKLSSSYREAQFGRDSLEFARASLKLAALYCQSNRLKEPTKKEKERYKAAKRLFKHAIAVIQNVRGPDHPDLAIAEVHFAQLYTQRQKYQKVVPLLNHSITILEKYAQVISSTFSPSSLY